MKEILTIICSQQKHNEIVPRFTLLQKLLMVFVDHIKLTYP